MKKLALLLALLLAITPAAQALTFTNADIKQPIFPWEAYTLQLSLYTDVAADINYTPYPAEGTLVMITLESLEGDIALEDIRNGYTQFVLRDADDNPYAPISWRVTRVTVQNNLPATSETQPGFDLIYLLPVGVSAGGTALLIGKADANEHIFVQLPQGETDQAATATAAWAPTATPLADEPSEAVVEMTEEPTAMPVVEATATPAPVADAMAGKASEWIASLLSAEAAKASDPWVGAILADGAQDVKRTDGELTFSLRSYNPGWKGLDVTATDYQDQIYANLSAFNLPCTLKVAEEGGSLTVTDKDWKAFLKTVTKAASTAKKAFGNKAMYAALLAVLASDKLSGATGGEYAPLFATQNKAKLTLTDGPHALALNVAFANNDTLLQKGYDAALLRLAKQGGASALSAQEIGAVFVEELGAQAPALKKKATEKQTFVLDIDKLFAGDQPLAGDTYYAFLGAYIEAYGNNFTVLENAAYAMPDYPALDMPGSGWVSGTTGGTKVIFKTPADGYARYVQMRSAVNEEAVVSAFIQSGDTVSIRVPKGMYYILVAVGNLWYGPEHLFGDTGSYVRSDQIEILGSNYYHTITLGGITDGNMSTYGADPSSFQ